MKRLLVGSRNSKELRVWLDGNLITPKRSQKVWNHSPTGFEAGYNGSGPAQLALAVLLECGLTDEAAIQYHQQFKFDVIANLTGNAFTKEFDLEAWLKEVDAARELQFVDSEEEKAKKAGTP